MSKMTPKCTQVDPIPGSLCSIEHSPYGFDPDLWVGVVFSALFGILTLAHIGLIAYHRFFPKFMIVAIIGSTGELVGWIARTYGAPHPFDRSAYLAQIICLIICPAFISALNYVAFQHVMDVFGHKWSRIPRKWYVRGFVAGDICSLVVQAAGGAISAEANTEAAINTGKAIMIAGVVIQVAVTAPFLALYVDYNLRRFREWSKPAIPKSERPFPKAEFFNTMIGVSTLFILTRCTYRIVEMCDGWKGYLSTTQVYFAVLDGLMMVFAIGVFIPFHPGFFLPKHVSNLNTGSNVADDASDTQYKAVSDHTADTSEMQYKAGSDHTTPPFAAHTTDSVGTDYSSMA